MPEIHDLNFYLKKYRKYNAKKKGIDFNAEE